MTTFVILSHSKKRLLSQLFSIAFRFLDFSSKMPIFARKFIFFRKNQYSTVVILLRQLLGKN